MSVGDKIKKYISKKGISQSDLAILCGMSPSKLCLSLSGKRNFKVEEYETICYVLKVSAGTFLEPRKPKKSS